MVLLVSAATGEKFSFVPCQEISPELRFPCSCALDPTEESLEGPSLLIDCDRVVFPHDLAFIPYGAPIVSFSHRFSGHQSLPSQVCILLTTNSKTKNNAWKFCEQIFSSSLPLRSLDLSHNSLRKLTERMLHTLQSTLTELRLSHNLLGDTLNPIFSTSEFRGLKHLHLLDLSSNGIKSIEEGIFEGCHNLKVNANFCTLAS